METDHECMRRCVDVGVLPKETLVEYFGKKRRKQRDKT